MAKLIRRRFVDVVSEASYGVDPGSGRTALLPYSDLALSIEGNPVVRDVIRNTFSPRGQVITDKMATMTLPLELRGAGDDGAGGINVPETDALLKACSMQREDGAHIVLTGVTGDFEIGETVTNDTVTGSVGTVADWDSVNSTLYIRALGTMPSASDSISGDTSSATGTVDSADDAYVYRPASQTPDSQDSVYARFDLDGLLHQIPGARGTFSISLSRSEIPRINFNLSGNYLKPTDGGPISGTALSLTPEPVLGANLRLGGLDMSTVAVNAVSLDLANDVQPRPDIQADDGYHSHMVVGRDPTGSIDPEVSSIAGFDPYTDWENANDVVVAAGIGSAQGTRIRVVCPKTQYTQLPYSERNGIATYDLGFRATGDDDEFMLIYS